MLQNSFPKNFIIKVSRKVLDKSFKRYPYLEENLCVSILQDYQDLTWLERILAFFSCLAPLVAKGVFIAYTVLLYQGCCTSILLLYIVVLLFVPQFILALFSTVGLSISSLKLVVQHPETVLLPIGTSLNRVQTGLESIWSSHKVIDRW